MRPAFSAACDAWTEELALSEIHKFIFDGMPVRGMLVKLTDSWRSVLARRSAADDAFAPEVRALLGEMAAAATLMQASIKFNGALVLQVLGDGPVKLTVAEVQPDLAFRVTAKVVGEVAPGSNLTQMLNQHGRGRCAITLDPKDKLPGQQPYQGVVPLHGDHREPLNKISEVLEHYMLQSEQLDTRLILAANDETAAGLLIQRLPVTGVGNLEGTLQQPLTGDHTGREDDIGLNEDYNRLAHLASTLTAQELLELEPLQVLHRLFWEEPLRRFEPQEGPSGPYFACSCSRERVGNMLVALGRQEVDDVIREQSRVEVACDFCGQRYHFDAVDVGELFTPKCDQAPGSNTLN
jgi:molecular chaperone Hsp33